MRSSFVGRDGTLIPLIATVAAAGFLFTATASAQNSQAQSPSTGSSDQTQNIPDQKLDAIAAALKQVASIKQNYQRKIEEAAPSDKERIADEANNALTTAVTDQGLSVEEYTSILRVAQNDPAVREKIFQRLDSSNGSSSGR